ncbi:MAG: hypothetical protein AAF658_10490 [Myxococcota bacterium]
MLGRLSVLMLFAGCACDASPGSSAEATGPSVARSNLDSAIEAADGLYADTGALLHASRIVDLRLTRSQFYGLYASDFARVRAVTDSVVERLPQAPEPLVLRARVRSSLHEFASARRDYDLARDRGARVDTTVIDLASGEDLQFAYDTRLAHAKAYPSFNSFVDVAAAAGALGSFEEADEWYVDALELYRDVSPFPRAWVAFQRGVLWGESADRADLAIAHYRDAVEWLPGFVNANVHLAELEVESGSKQAAIDRLERVAFQTEDPEPGGFLGELLMKTDPNRASRLVESAKNRYEHLLERFPLAFLDHASEFFAGVGADPERALRLAEHNLESRRNPRAFVVAIESAVAAKRPDAACSFAELAAAHTGQNVNLANLVRSLSCGDER